MVNAPARGDRLTAERMNRSQAGLLPPHGSTLAGEWTNQSSLFLTRRSMARCTAWSALTCRAAMVTRDM